MIFLPRLTPLGIIFFNTIPELSILPLAEFFD